MKYTLTRLTLRSIAAIAAGCLLPGSPLAAQTNPAPATTPAPVAPIEDETLVLSPFVVDASAETGYLATQTLSGTRVKTDMKDIGSAMTIFTEQLMDDLGANNINDLIAFAPNTDPSVVSLTDNNTLGNNFINNATEYITRGGTTGVVAQDFFDNGIPNDRFNSEALTFTRGPNAILFGLGNASGAFVSSTKRAKYKTATTVEGQFDDRGSYRYTLDHNQVLIKDKLAFRFAGLYDAQNSFRFPAESFQRRQFYTMRLNPFPKTTVRVNHETGYIRRAAIRPWPAFDSVSPWLDRGAQLYPVYTNRTNDKPTTAGLVNIGSNSLVSTEFSPAGTFVPTQSMINTAGTLATRPGEGYPTVGANRRSFMRDDIYPIFATGYGGAFQEFDYNLTSVFLEQEITRNFFIEAAFNQVENNSRALNSGAGDALSVDPNVQLPGGIPNPNVGMLYTESTASVIDRPSNAMTKRIMASYELDFTRRDSKWVQALGKHRIAAFYEDLQKEEFSSNNGIRNVTPLATTGAAAAINNAANTINYRYYYDPAAGKVGNTGIEFGRYPTIYANDPLPPTGPGGITPAFVAIQGGNASDTEIKTKALALQSYFWKEKIVLTNGWRKDDTLTYRAVPDDFPRDARGIAADPTLIDTRSVASNIASRPGKTYSRGIVYHMFPWMSLTWNTSDNFLANDNTRDIYGNLLPNPKGKGSDYGLKFEFFDRKLFMELVYYTNSTIDKFDGLGGVAGTGFATHFNQIWDNVATFTNDPKYTTAPYSASGVGWSDNATSTSNGYEFSVTARPTKQWRITLNGSKRGHSTTTARGNRVEAYINEFIPIIKSHPEWQGIVTTNNLTVASRVATIEEGLSDLKALQNVPEDAYAPTWTLNLVQNYSFEGRLKGWSIGQTLSTRGRAINGFAEDADRVLDPSKPYYGSATMTFGGMLSYQRKIFNNRINWKLQLNVRNIFNHDVVIPLRSVDLRDGLGTRTTAIYTIRDPRTYQITSTFKF